MNKILYATDCKQFSVNALHFAHHLSRILKADLVVLSVYDIPPIRISTTRPTKQIKKFAYEEHCTILQAYCLKNLDKELNGTNVRAEVIENVSVANGIISKSKELMVDMIVIGMKDQYSERGLFAGDIAKKLIGRAQFPLLTIPNSISHNKLETIVYATDFEQDDIYAIKKIAELATPFKAIIKVIHITTKNEYAGEDQMEWFKEMLQQRVHFKNMKFDLIFSDNIYEELSAYIDNVGADLLVMLEREDHGFFHKLTHNDLVKKMESNITIPLLSFNKTSL